VEDVTIPKMLKIKVNSHRKNITSMKFNSFGTNLISTGMDGFIRIWDANKSNKRY
jgi:WD40 repeat protein